MSVALFYFTGGFMAQYDGSIRINTQLNTREFERASRSLVSGMERVGKSLNRIIGSLGFAIGIAGLVALGRQAIDTASDIQEVQNVVDTAFGSMSYKMEQFAKTSVKQFGISQLSAKRLGSTFMAMGKSMVGDMEKSSNMAINLTARAADMASFYNKSVEETATALKSIYTGETETLKEYGVVMTQVNLQEFARQQGISKSIQKMKQAEKVELQYAYVMQQTALAAGDFARTSDSWANQTRILSEQFKELLSVIGTGLITVLTPVIKFLNTVLSTLIAIAKQIGAILSKLFGISMPVVDSGKMASNLSDAAGGADALADGMDAAGKAAKKAGKAASKALAPFDKLNVLSKDSGGGSDAGAGGAGSGISMPELPLGKEDVGIADALNSALDGVLGKLKELKGLFVTGFFEGFGDYKPKLEDLKKDILSIGNTLKGIFTDPGVVSAANSFANQLTYSLGQITGSIASIGLTIAQLLVGGIEKYLTQNKDRIKQYIISMFDIGAEIAAIIGDFSVAFADIFSVFGGDTAQQIVGNLIGIFSEVGMMISETVLKLGRDILNMITQPIIENKDKIKDAIEGTLQAIEPFTSGLLTAVQTVRDAVSDIYDNHLKPLFDSIASGLSDILGRLLDGYNTYIVPVLQGLGERFKEIMEGPFGETIEKVKDFIGKLIDSVKSLWENVLVPFFSWIASNIMPVLASIVDFIGNTIMTALKTVINVVGDIADALGGVIDFIVGVFTGDWGKAWEGIKSIFSGVWNVIKDFFSGIWNILKSLVKNGVDYVKAFIKVGWECIKLITSTVWDAIKGVLTTIWNGLKALVSTVFNAIKTAVSTVWDGIKTATSTVWNGIKTGISTVINGIKTGISTALNAIKSIWDTVWTGLKTTVTNIFNGIWGVIKGVINNILAGIETMANGVIDGINFVIKALNNFKVDFPDWVPLVGGKTLGFNISELNKVSIPRLADGAVIRGGDPFMAVLGDQRHGQTNIETPLPTMVKAFKQAMSESGGAGGEVTVKVYLGEKDITQAVKTEADTYFKRTGKSLFAY